jgi:hypothetical protein
MALLSPLCPLRLIYAEIFLIVPKYITKLVCFQHKIGCFTSLATDCGGIKSRVSESSSRLFFLKTDFILLLLPSLSYNTHHLSHQNLHSTSLFDDTRSFVYPKRPWYLLRTTKYRLARLYGFRYTPESCNLMFFETFLVSACATYSLFSTSRCLTFNPLNMKYLISI